MKAAIPRQIDPQVVEHYVRLSPAYGRMRKLAELALADDMAIRMLFYQPETQALLRAEGDVDWRAVLRYSTKHYLQSVLDEYPD